MQNTNIMPAVSQLAFKIFCANLKYFLHQGNLVAGAKLQAPSLKLRSSFVESTKPQAHQGTSHKHQAPSTEGSSVNLRSYKPQA